MAVATSMCLLMAWCCTAQAVIAQQQHQCVWDGGGSALPGDAAPACVEEQQAVSLPGTAAPESQAAIAWVEANGGRVAIAVRRVPCAGKSTWAPHAFRKGDILAAVPLQLLYNVTPDAAGSHVHAAALRLLADLSDPDSPWATWFASLPGPHEVWSHGHIPASYARAIQCPATEAALAQSQAALQRLWQEQGAPLAAAGRSFGDLQYALALLMTRLFDFQAARGLTLVPVVDNANHRQGCPHAAHDIGPCSPGSSQRCLLWVAGADLAAGEEVCLEYKWLLNDRALLQYGFLQSGAMAAELSSMDRHDFDAAQPFADPPQGKHGPRRFEGSPAQLQAEMGRLLRLHAELSARDAEAVGMQPDPADPGGWFLAELRSWRAQRSAAISTELDRLGRQLARLTDAQTAAGSRAIQQSALDGLAAWMQAQGAQLAVSPRVLLDSEAAPLASTSGLDQPEPRQPRLRSGVFAGPAGVAAGGLLAELPLRTGFPVGDGLQGLLDAGMDLMLALFAPHAARPELLRTLGPWLASLPPLGSVDGAFSFPLAYLPLLQSTPLEHHLLALAARLGTTWEAQRPRIEAADASLGVAQLQHATNLVSQRLLGLESGLLVLPLLDAARQVNGCPHEESIGPCSSDASQSCLLWTAGADLAPGAEVCTSSGWMPPDHALLQAGRLSWPWGAELSGVDLRLFDPGDPLGHLASGHNAPEPWLPGSQAEALDEVSRLAAIDLTLTASTAAAEAEATPPAEQDTDARLLAALLAWRAGRAVAVQAEIGRLVQLAGLSEQAVNTAVAARLAGQPLVSEEHAGRGSEAAGGGDPFAALLDWVRANGGQVSVAVSNSSAGGRALVAPEAIAEGDTLLLLPLNLTFSQGRDGGAGSHVLAAAHLAQAMRDPGHRLAPYFASLPSHAELRCPLVFLPAAYLPLLQHADIEAAVVDFQADIALFWSEHQAQLSAAGVSLADLQAARCALSTRAFGLRDRLKPVPILDLANHANDCPHHLELEHCTGEPSQSCLRWTAGASLAPGAEVCNLYSWMLNDKAMLQYGFLQAGPVAAAVAGIDRHDYDASRGLWHKSQPGQQPAPSPFVGDMQQTRAELQRLRALVDALAERDAATAGLQPAEGDEGGALLALLRTWRRQRAAGLAAEVQRLEGVLARDQAAADMLAWMADAGGDVSRVRIGRQSASAAAADAAASGQAVLAAEPIQAGEVIAAWPLSLCLPVAMELLADAATLAQAAQPGSPWQPYMRALPAPGAALSFHSLPRPYWRLLQHAPSQAYLAGLHAQLDAAPLPPGLSKRDVLHWAALVSSRAMALAGAGHVMVPLGDSADHANGCPNKIGVAPCPGHPSARCVVWTAGADLPAGSEVCNAFGWLLPDRSLLQYGFLEAQPQQLHQQPPAAVPLSGMDRPECEALLPWQCHIGTEEAPAPFAGTAEQLASEERRLQARARELAAGDAGLADLQPDPEVDPHGLLLAKLRAWRHVRFAGLAWEIDRLQQLMLQGPGHGSGASSSGSST